MVAEIKAKLTIIDIAERIIDIHLQKAGRNYKGLCPFHGENTPSFFVSPQKGIFKCFGCGESGDAITLVAKSKNISNGQAITLIAREFGFNLPQYKRNRVQKVVPLPEDKLKVLRRVSKEYYWQLITLRDIFKGSVKMITHHQDMFYLGESYHEIPYIEYLLEALSDGEFESIEGYVHTKKYLSKWELLLEDLATK